MQLPEPLYEHPLFGRADGDTATLTKADLIEAVAAEAGVTKKDAEEMVNAGWRR